jgi:hypothetical protein
MYIIAAIFDGTGRKHYSIVSDPAITKLLPAATVMDEPG